MGFRYDEPGARFCLRDFSELNAMIRDGSCYQKSDFLNGLVRVQYRGFRMLVNDCLQIVIDRSPNCKTEFSTVTLHLLQTLQSYQFPSVVLDFFKTKKSIFVDIDFDPKRPGFWATRANQQFLDDIHEVGLCDHTQKLDQYESRKRASNKKRF